MKTFLVVLLLFGCTSCAGTTAARLVSERANLKLAKELRDGWFLGKPIPTAVDQKLADKALADWERAIVADEQLLGVK